MKKFKRDCSLHHEILATLLRAFAVFECLYGFPAIGYGDRECFETGHWGDKSAGVLWKSGYAAACRIAGRSERNPDL